MRRRFRVSEGSTSGQRFAASVIDSAAGNNAICECATKADAEEIVEMLNAYLDEFDVT